MAYGTIVASVSEGSVAAYQASNKAPLQCSMSIFVSHLLAYWIQVEPLGSTLGKCIDGGVPLASRLWHPFRVPQLHDPVAVIQLANELEHAWNITKENEIVVQDDDFFGPQISNLVRLFLHAKSRNECVVTFLDKPSDWERASKVEIPQLAYVEIR
jgi:hypothetical protein